MPSLRGRSERVRNWEDTVSLLRELVDVPSPTGAEAPLGELVARWLAGSGFRVTRQPVARDRFNLLATTGAKPEVLLCTHLDTVSPHLPFREEGEVLWGRGACDAKGALAAMLTASQRLLAGGKTRFGLLLVVGEERDSLGAKKAAELEIASRYVLVGEPTDNRLAASQKGTLVFRIEAEGRSGHSAQPETGPSAVHRLLRLLSKWIEEDWGSHPEMGLTTVNIGVVGGGAGSNVIAPRAWGEGIFRVAGSVKLLRERITAALPDWASLEILGASEPLELATLPGFDTCVVSFGSDAPYLRPLGEVLMLGPGSIRHAHSDDERVGKRELLEAVTLYVRLVETLVERV
jgi:acetylornithine deacetylase